LLHDTPSDCPSIFNRDKHPFHNIFTVLVMNSEASCFRSGESSLRANAFAYDSLRERLNQVDWEKDPGGTLECLEHLADFAAANHPGRFADGDVENLALAIGGRLDDLLRNRADRLTRVRMPCVGRDSRRNVLHVVTAATRVGGLIRTVINWIRNDPESRHSVLLTRQEYSSGIRPLLMQTVHDNGGDFIVLPPADILMKARWVRQCVQSSVDLVILHQNWSDVVPIVAFAVDNCPAIALVNQLDHLFWLGSSVTDAVINLRELSQVITGKKRFARQDLLLPIPLIETAALNNRAEARQALGIPHEQIVLLTVGREVKYLRGTDQDFFNASFRILEENPSAHLYVVGVSQEFAARSLRDPRHDRLHFLGIVEDPSSYLAAANAYLESFPAGSQTAMLEAGLAGLPPVRAIAPEYPLLVAQDECLVGLVNTPADEDAYVEQASFLICNASERRQLGASLRERIIAAHVGRGWCQRLAAVYAAMERAQHQPRAIPRAECSADPEDIALSAWQDAVKEGGSGMKVPDDLQPPGRSLIVQLRDRSQRSSRLSSRRLFQFYLNWIDEATAYGRQDFRDARRRELLLCLADRLTWAKWERDWEAYYALRDFMRSQWNGPDPLPRIGRERVAPQFFYRIKDSLDWVIQCGKGILASVPT
jgi:glycosyltransferase involved in cell wall biosynthesis